MNEKKPDSGKQKAPRGLENPTRSREDVLKDFRKVAKPAVPAAQRPKPR